MSAQKIFPSANGIIACGRQTAQGAVRLKNLYKIKEVSGKFGAASNMSDLGIEVGSGSISQQRSVKESFMPEVDMSGHLRVGALLNLFCMLGYQPLAEGTDPGSPVTTTLNGAITTRHSKVATLTSISGLVAGDKVQIDVAASPGSPAITDKCMVHELETVGATNHVAKLYLSAGGGTFTVSVTAGGTTQTTAGIAYSATNSTIQTAVQGLSNVGSGQILVTGSVGGPFTFTAAGTFVSTNFAGAWTADGTSLTGAGAYATTIDTTQGAASAQVVFKGRLLYTYATGVAVKKIDSAKVITHTFWHIQPDSALEGDLYTIYYRFANSDGTIEGLYTDCAASSFGQSPQVGQIATFQATVKAINLTRYPGQLYSVYNTLLADPSDVTLNNTRGSFSILSNTIDAPRGVNFNFAADLYDDVVLTQYLRQSMVHLAHTLGISTSGKFIKDFLDQMIYNGATSYTVSDAIPENGFTFTLQSATTISTGVYYSLAFNAPDAQLAGYDPSYNTNQPLEGSIEMIKVVPQLSTGTERWKITAQNLCASDVYCAA